MFAATTVGEFIRSKKLELALMLEAGKNEPRPAPEKTQRDLEEARREDQ